MEFYSISFFGRDDDSCSPIQARLDLRESSYPITITIGDYSHGMIHLHLSRTHFTNLKNGILSASQQLDRALREVSR